MSKREIESSLDQAQESLDWLKHHFDHYVSECEGFIEQARGQIANIKEENDET